MREREFERRQLRAALHLNISDVIGTYDIDSETFDSEIIYESEPVDIELEGTVMEGVVIRRSVNNFDGVFRLDGEEQGFHFITEARTGIYELDETGKMNRRLYIDEVFDKFPRPNFEDIAANSYLTNNKGDNASLEELNMALKIVKQVRYTFHIPERE